MTTSPTRTKQKLSLRKRLFVKKSPKVGCYVDTDSNDEFSQSTSRPMSPADPFLAQSAQCNDLNTENRTNRTNLGVELNTSSINQYSDNCSNDDENNPKCCKTFFRKSRPRSLADGSSSKNGGNSKPSSPLNNSSNSLSDQTISGTQSKSDEISKATVVFPNSNGDDKCYEHTSSLEGIKQKSKLFVKRLSADHLISSDTKPLYRSSSPESDRSSSLDRKRRYITFPFITEKKKIVFDDFMLYMLHLGLNRPSHGQLLVLAALTAWLATHCLLHKCCGSYLHRRLGKGY